MNICNQTSFADHSVSTDEEQKYKELSCVVDIDEVTYGQNKCEKTRTSGGQDLILQIEDDNRFFVKVRVKAKEILGLLDCGAQATA